MKLGEFLDHWLRVYIEPKRAINTVRAYQYALMHLSEDLRGTELQDLDPIRIQLDVNLLAAQYSRQAQLLYRGLSAALNRAVRLKLIESSPMQFVDAPEHEKREAVTLTEAEAAAYYQAAEGTPLLRLMLVLGLRRNEARGVKHGDLCNGILRIRRQRTRNGKDAPLKSRSSRRDLPVPEALWPLFYGPPGEYIMDISESGLRKRHMAILRKIGVEGVTLHGLRHSCATLAAANDIPLSSIQHLLGHRHIALTADLYCHADLKPLSKCVYQLYNNFAAHMGKCARLEIV